MGAIQTRTPKICVSLANSDMGKLRRDAQTALAEGSNYVEIRFDAAKATYNHEVYTQVFEAVADFQKRLVFTLRSKQQGGRFKGSASEAQAALKFLASRHPMLLDIELDLALEKPTLVKAVQDMRIPVLISHHDWQGTPSESRLLEVLNRMLGLSDWAKIVTTANTPDDAFRVIGLYEHVSAQTKLISFAMGEAGSESRLASGLAVNSPFTFAALDKASATAPGQLTLKQMQRFYRRRASHLEVDRLLRQDQ